MTITFMLKLIRLIGIMIATLGSNLAMGAGCGSISCINNIKYLSKFKIDNITAYEIYASKNNLVNFKSIENRTIVKLIKENYRYIIIPYANTVYVYEIGQLTD